MLTKSEIEKTDYAKKFFSEQRIKKQNEVLSKIVVKEIGNFEEAEQVTIWQIIWFLLRNSIKVIKIVYYLTRLILIIQKIFNKIRGAK